MMKVRRRFVRRLLRRRPRRFRRIFRRRFRRRRRRPVASLYRRVYRSFQRPVLVRFFRRYEAEIPGDQYHSHMVFNLNAFNNDAIRQQLYGYLEVFDQFKVIRMEMRFHFKTSAEFTSLNTPIPEAYWAYDSDMQSRMIDVFNIQKLPNMRTKLMPPMTFLNLRLRPRWKEQRLSTVVDGQRVNLDTHITIPRVDNPWMDTYNLTIQGGQAPSVDANNGYAVAILNGKKRTMIIYQRFYVLFRGRRNNQTYTTPD